MGRPDLDPSSTQTEIGAGRRRELLETDRRRQAGRPAAYDNTSNSIDSRSTCCASIVSHRLLAQPQSRLL
jgi:hypothetical protein